MTGEHKLPQEVSYTTTRYRRWWQFWKPKSWTETNRYCVVPGFYTDANVTLLDGYSASSNRVWVTEWDAEGNPVERSQ